MIVDSHVHIWSDDPEKYPPLPAYSQGPGRAASAENLFEVQEPLCVSRTVAIQPSWYGYDHSYLLDALAAYPDRLVGVALADPRDADMAEKLAKLCEGGLIQGVRLNAMSDPDPAWLDDPSTDAIWGMCEELDVPVTLLMKPSNFERADRMVRRHPKAKTVIDHFGRCSVGEGPPHSSFQQLLEFSGNENVFLKASAFPVASADDYPYGDISNWVRMALDAFGRERVMWGTDYPFILDQCGYQRGLTVLIEETPFLTDEDREWLLWRTAHRLWTWQRTSAPDPRRAIDVLAGPGSNSPPLADLN